MELSAQHSYIAYQRIQPLIRKTAMVESQSLSAISQSDVRLKLEQTQITGSFKLRGASNAIAALSDEAKARGVVGFSTGNHGRGLAYAAAHAGVKAIICMSDMVPKNKVEGIKAQGAEVKICGHSQDDAEREVISLMENGMTMISPFDHPDIIAGQGTLAIEMLAQAPDLETVIVPLSGGGLICGIAMVLKAVNPKIKIIGVTMERGAAMYQSIKAGKPIPVEEIPTLADSLGGGIGLDNQYTFEMTKKLVDEMILVSEDEIAAAIHHAYWQERQIIEGSGSVAVAALLAGKVKKAGQVVALISGQNIDMGLHQRLINGEKVQL